MDWIEISVWAIIGPILLGFIFVAILTIIAFIQDVFFTGEASIIKRAVAIWFIFWVLFLFLIVIKGIN